MIRCSSTLVIYGDELATHFIPYATGKVPTAVLDEAIRVTIDTKVTLYDTLKSHSTAVIGGSDTPYTWNNFDWNDYTNYLDTVKS